MCAMRLCLSACLAVSFCQPGRCPAQSLDTLHVSVQGHRMHLLVGGHGTPTIVLEAGSASTSRTWRALQPLLATLSRVVSYDRAGLGSSALSSRPRSARAIAEELHAALRMAHLAPPYLVVGHSAGGLYARVFAATYPTEVTGLVLVDPAPEDFYARAQRDFPRVFQRLDSIDAAGFAQASPGERAEEDAWDTTLAEARVSDSLFTGPAIVLSSSRADLAELGPLWTDEHRRWALRSPRRSYVRVDSVGHHIHRERPTIVVEAVERLLARLAPTRP